VSLEPAELSRSRPDAPSDTSAEPVNPAMLTWSNDWQSLFVVTSVLNGEVAIASRRNKVPNMWRRKCPVCRLPMAKKHPTETVPCPCGKYVWKG